MACFSKRKKKIIGFYPQKANILTKPEYVQRWFKPKSRYAENSPITDFHRTKKMYFLAFLRDFNLKCWCCKFFNTVYLLSAGTSLKEKSRRIWKTINLKFSPVSTATQYFWLFCILPVLQSDFIVWQNPPGDPLSCNFSTILWSMMFPGQVPPNHTGSWNHDRTPGYMPGKLTLSQGKVKTTCTHRALDEGQFCFSWFCFCWLFFIGFFLLFK